MIEVIVREIKQNLKLAMQEFRVDRSSFTSGIKVLVGARSELAEARLIPEVFDVVEREFPAPHDRLAVSPEDDY